MRVESTVIWKFYRFSTNTKFNAKSWSIPLITNNLCHGSESIKTNFSWTITLITLIYSRADVKPKQSATVISYHHCKAALKQSILLKALNKWRWLDLTFQNRVHHSLTDLQFLISLFIGMNEAPVSGYSPHGLPETGTSQRATEDQRADRRSAVSSFHSAKLSDW